jgi:asparagine synthetase B (glutamine-hydrolysing)
VDSGYWLAELSRRPPPMSGAPYVSPPSITGRRLLVSTAGAPTVLERGSCTVLFDGELYDGSRVVRGSEAAQRGLSVYLSAADPGLAKLRGAFALIVWDRARDAAVCIRDPMGVQPLFYAETQDSLFLSPSPDRLAYEPAVSKDINRLALAEWAVRGDTEPDETFFEAVRRILPGHRLDDERGARRIRRFWVPELGGEPMHATQVLETFEHLLDQAVERSIGAGRTAVFLSGGVDSATVAASIAHLCRTRDLPGPLALSLKYAQPDADEEPAQRTVAGALQLEQIVAAFADLSEGSLVLGSLKSSAEAWFPPLNPTAPAWDTLVLQGKALGCDTFLSGDGGNDSLEVGWPWAADLIRRFEFRQLREFIVSERVFYGSPMAAQLVWRSGLRLLARAAVEPWLRQTAPRLVGALLRRRRAHDLPAWALPGAQLRRAVLERRAARPVRRPVRGSFAAGNRLRLLESPHLSILLEMDAQTARCFNVTIRQPLFDADLVEFLVRTEPHVLHLGGEVKGLARTFLRRRLGEHAVRALVSKYANPAVDAELEADAGRALDALGGMPLLSELGIVNEQAFRYTVKNLGAPNNSSYAVWDALACEAWLQARTGITNGERISG